MLPLLMIALTAPGALEARLIAGSRNETFTPDTSPPVLLTRFGAGAGLRYAGAFDEDNRFGPSVSIMFLTPRNVEGHAGAFYERTLWRKERSTAFAGLSAAVTLWNGVNSDVGDPWGLAAGGEIGLALDVGRSLQLILRAEALARLYFYHPVTFFPVVSVGLRF